MVRRSDSGIAAKNLDRELELTNDSSNPFYVIVSPDKTLLGAKGGYNEPEVFVAFLKSMLDKHKGASGKE